MLTRAKHTRPSSFPSFSGVAAGVLRIQHPSRRRRRGLANSKRRDAGAAIFQLPSATSSLVKHGSTSTVVELAALEFEFRNNEYVGAALKHVATSVRFLSFAGITMYTCRIYDVDGPVLYNWLESTF